MPRLILPDTRYLASYVKAMREGFCFGICPILPEDEIKKIEVDPFDHFEGYNRQGGTFTPTDGIPRPSVHHNFYWLVDDKDFIGAISVRYELNDFLEIHAGHLGYGIRPAMKRKGFAKKIVSLGLKKLKEKGVTRVLITADDDNIGSWKAIEANGGVMENKIPSIFTEGHLSRRYWIDLAKEEKNE